jgi:hypothetical protein
MKNIMIKSALCFLVQAHLFAGGDLVTSLGTLQQNLTTLANKLIAPKAPPVVAIDWEYKTFKDWSEACQGLELYKTVYNDTKIEYPYSTKVFDEIRTKFKVSTLSLGEFKKAIQEFSKFSVTLMAPANWKDKSGVPEANFFDLSQDVDFVPFVQKVLIPANEVVVFHGGLYGDVQSLLRLLQKIEGDDFKGTDFIIQQKTRRYIFLGNYFDNGYYGPEVLYTLLRLKIANPDQVYLLRGNEAIMSTVQQFLQARFTTATQADSRMVTRLFDLFPLALYAGSENATSKERNFVQCSAAGIELFYKPTNFLSDDATFERFFKDVPAQDMLRNIRGIGPIEGAEIVSVITLAKPADVGFLGNSFTLDSNAVDNAKPATAPQNISYTLTKQFLDYASDSEKKIYLRGVFSGGILKSFKTPLLEFMIDENSSSRGVAKLWPQDANAKGLWQGMVFTFVPAPNCLYGTANLIPEIGDFDACGLLTLQDDFAKWAFDVQKLS